jgi:hypothetical protein
MSAVEKLAVEQHGGAQGSTYKGFIAGVFSGVAKLSGSTLYPFLNLLQDQVLIEIYSRTSVSPTRPGATV